MTTMLGTDLIVIVLTALATFVALHAWDYRSSRIFVVVVATLIVMNILTSLRPLVNDPTTGYVLASMSLLALVTLITALMFLTSALFAPQWWTGTYPIRLIALPYIAAFILVAIDLISGVNWFIAGVYLDEAGVYRFQPVQPYAVILLATSTIGLLVLLGILIVAFVREQQVRFAISLLFGSIVIAMVISLLSTSSPFLSGMTHTITTLPIMVTLGYIVLRTPLLTPTQAALDLALQATDDAVAVLDPDNQVVYANPSAGALGITLGQSLNSFVDPAAERTAPDQPTISSHSRRFQFSGRNIIVNYTEVVNRRGKMLGTLLLGRDVTDLEQRTEQLACERERLATTVQQLETAQQERLQLLATLQASETRFRTLVESMDDIIFTLDHEQRYTGVFGHWLERYGIPPGAFLGKTPRETSPDATAVTLHEAANARALKGEYVVYEWSFGDPPATIQTSLSPMRDDSGNITGIVGVGRDISSIKELEAALRAGEERYRSIIATMHDGFVLQDASGAICEWNQRAEEILELTGDQLQGCTSFNPCCQAIYPEGHPFPDEAHPAMVTLRTGRPCFQVVMGIRKPNGTLTWILVNAQPLFRNGIAAPYAVFTTFMDITEQKAMEEALKLSEQRYRALVESSEDSIFQIDPAGTYLFINTAGARTIGRPADEIIGCHVSDLFPTDAAELTLHFLETVSQTTQPIHVERPLPVNGTVRAYSTVLVPLLDGNEQVTSVVGIGRDMTERKQAEEALRMSRARLRAIFDNAAAGIALASADDHFLEVNQGWCAMLGYTAAEAGALTHQEIVHPDDLRANQAQIDAFKRGETTHFSAEQRLVRKDGSIFWGNVSVTPIYSSQDNIEAFIAIITDITERKRVETALQQTNTELILLSEMSDLLQACRTEAEAAIVIAQIAPQLFPDLSGALYTISASRTQATAIAVWGTLPVPHVCAPHECWSLRRGRPHLSHNDQPALVCMHLPDPLPESALCYPMIAQSETLGIFHLCRETGPLTEATQQLATTTAEHLSLALANVQLRATLRHQAIRDPLTGLFNRRYMEDSLERELQRAARYTMTLGVIMLDLDHFKRFNDTFGHAAGDTILRELGNLLQSHLRDEDIACRYGGEEFALIILDAPLATIMQRAEQLRAAVQQLTIIYREQSLGTVTISLGVAVYPDHGITMEEVVHAADAALYKAKAAGRNRVMVA